MKHNGIPRFWLLAFGLGLVIAVHASAQSVRVAVAGDPSLANLVDVTTGELSKQPELGVIDRADLDKLGQEEALQAALDSKDFSSVHVLPADGLVLLRAVAKEGKTGVFARLVAVQPGVVLREVALPDGADPVAQARALEKEFAPYWSKLAAIPKGKITALSLLGLRFDVDSPQTRDMERRINLLLASRLSAEPDILVLERWRLNDALFEKTLAPQQPSPFWTGSSLIDGGLRWETENNRIDVTLRVRPPQGPGVSISDQDTPENLPALVERLAAKISARPMAPGVWKPGDEADHFTVLGRWCLDNHLYEEGAEALESALALGDNTRTTHMLEIKAYAMEAYPDINALRSLVPESDEYRRDLITPDSVPQRVTAATRAAHLMRDYLTTNRDFSSKMWNAEDPVDLSVPVLYTCLRALRAAYDNGFQTNHADEVAGLRHEVQTLISAIGEKLLPQPPSLQRGHISIIGLFMPVCWHEKPEETIAFYREILNDKTDGAWMRNMLFQSQCAHEPCLDGEGELFSRAPWSVGPPWIVAWDGRSPDEVKTLWQNFLKELAASSDPILQCDALKFEYASNRTVAGRHAVVERFVPFLKQHVDSITGPRGNEFVTDFQGLYPQALGDKANQASYDDIEALYVPLFKQHVVLPPSWVSAMSSLVEPRTPTETAKSLLDGLNDYSQWYQTQTPQEYNVTQAIDQVRRAIYEAKPELVPTPPTEPATDYLVVNHLWDNRSVLIDSGPNANTLRGFDIDSRTIVPEGNNVWFMTQEQPRTIYCVDSSTLQLVSSCAIPEKHVYDPKHLLFPPLPSFLEVTPQWLVAGLNGLVLLCSRSDNQWRTLDLPLSYYKPVWVNQQLYLIYDAYGIRGSEHDPAGLHSASSGLIRVSLPEGTTESLVSSRRIPPQSALDGKPHGTAMNLWVRQSVLTLAFINQEFGLQIYAAPIGRNDWSPFLTEKLGGQVWATSGGALIRKALKRYGY